MSSHMSANTGKKRKTLVTFIADKGMRKLLPYPLLGSTKINYSFLKIFFPKYYDKKMCGNFEKWKQ